MTKYISRDLALSHPFANGQYDHKHAEPHFILGYESYKEWLESLPTIEIPAPHGRLIDAEMLEKECCHGCEHEANKYSNCIDCALANAPTVIEAEGE